MKCFFITLLSFFIAFSGYSQKIKSQLAYTLGSGEEIIFQLEHQLAITKKGTESRIFISKIKGSAVVYYCIENGKKKGPYQEIMFSNDNEVYSYKKNGKWYHHRAEKTYGPFTKVLHSYYENVFFASTNKQMYIYLNSKKIRKIELTKGAYPRPQVRRIALAKNGNYAFVAQENGKWKLIVNGKIIREVDKHPKYGRVQVRVLKISDNGKYIFAYANHGQWKVNLNGKDVQNLEPGRYQGSSNFSKATLDPKTGKYSYHYSLQGKAYGNINGKPYGPYGSTQFNTDKKGNTYFRYTTYKDKKYYSINGKINGPYKKYNVDYYQRENYYYTTLKDKDFVLIKGKTYGPYSKITWLTIKENTYAYKFDRDGASFVNINGKEYGPYEKSDVKIDKTGFFLIRYKKNGGAYVFVDNKTFGPFKNVTKHEVLDGKYCFAGKKDGKFYLIVNGKKLGEFDRVTWNTNPTYQNYKKGKDSYYRVNGTEVKAKYAQILTSPNRAHSLLIDNPNNIFYIDGKKQKQNNIFAQGYNENRNSFSWFSLKGKKIMINEHKLK